MSNAGWANFGSESSTYTSSYAAPSPAPLSCSRSCAHCWLRPPTPPPPPPPPPALKEVLEAEDAAASLPDNALRAPLAPPPPSIFSLSLSTFSRLCRKQSSLALELTFVCPATPRVCAPPLAPPLATLLEDERRKEEERALEGRALALVGPLHTHTHTHTHKHTHKHHHHHPATTPTHWHRSYTQTSTSPRTRPHPHTTHLGSMPATHANALGADLPPPSPWLSKLSKVSALVLTL